MTSVDSLLYSNGAKPIKNNTAKHVSKLGTQNRICEKYYKFYIK